MVCLCENCLIFVCQLTHFLSTFKLDEELVRQIREYKASARTDDNVIHDICDGKLYKERFRKDGYFHGATDAQLGELHISLQMNTDGVSLFRSSNFCIWPIYFVINELPPHQRYAIIFSQVFIKNL